MRTIGVSGVRLLGIESCLPEREADNRVTCERIFGDKAESVLKTTGILKRRVAEPGETSLDLCCRAARRLMERLAVSADDIAAVVSVSFTPKFRMPGNAQLAQAELGLGPDTVAFDLDHACAGYPYGLYLAARLALDLNGKILLLDGDVQTPHADLSTAPLLSDAGSATLVAPDTAAGEWRFAFMTDGSRADDLKLEDRFSMDGFGVFRFVAVDVARFLGEFVAGGEVDVFVPHQANVYMILELAKKLGLRDVLAITGDKYGNCASASIPVTLAELPVAATLRKVLLAGFGGGLSASAALIEL